MKKLPISHEQWCAEQCGCITLGAKPCTVCKKAYEAALQLQDRKEKLMTRMFKAHVKPGTKLQDLSRDMKESLKYDIETHSCDGWKDRGLVLKRDPEFCQKVKITLIIEKVKA
jgi:hypothetical protein